MSGSYHYHTVNSSTTGHRSPLSQHPLICWFVGLFGWLFIYFGHCWWYIVETSLSSEPTTNLFYASKRKLLQNIFAHILHKCYMQNEIIPNKTFFSANELLFDQQIKTQKACGGSLHNISTNHTKNTKKNWTMSMSPRIHPNLRSTVYCNAIAAGGVEEWDFGWRMLKKVTVAAEAVKLRSALACAKEPWLLNR